MLFRLLKPKSLQKCSSLTFSVNRTEYAARIKTPFTERYIYKLKSELKEEKAISKQDWTRIRQEFIDADIRVNDRNVDAQILELCHNGNPQTSVHNALSYMDLLKDFKIEPNIPTLSTLLKIFYNKSLQSKLSTEELTIIKAACHDIKSKTSTILDVNTGTNLICALVLTDDWKEAIGLHEQVHSNYGHLTKATSAIVGRAFKEDDVELGFKLLRNVADSEAMPKCEMFESYWDYCHRQGKNVERNVEIMLEYVRDQEIFMSKKSVDGLNKLLKDHIVDFEYSKINNRGMCSHCNNSLSTVQLTPEEFMLLQKTFIEKVLVRDNIFLSTNPNELQMFKKLMEKEMPFDYVIDGLNVAYSIHSANTSLQNKGIEFVVNYFANQNKRVLLLGRKHMKKFNNWNNITSKCTVFLTENISKDDPYILYATLLSGPKTNYVSRDLMRGHACLLGTELKKIFRRWQQEHQYHLIRIDKYAPFERHIQFNVFAHKNGGTWHVPYIDNYAAHVKDIFEMPKTWACINL